jgi:hypothetical protein
VNLEAARQPVHPAPHPDITVLCRIPYTVNGLTWTRVLQETQARLELGILRTLQPSPWSILDGTIGWELDVPDGKPYIVLVGVWRQS